MNTPIIDSLRRYSDEKNIRFHMPGHKGSSLGHDSLSTLENRLFDLDVTEVDGTDNLHCPQEAIEKSQQIAAGIYKAYKSYYLINGSTCGVYAMIAASVNRGDKIIIQRNCHRSVFMACFMWGLRIEYITPTVLEGFDIAASIDPAHVQEVVENNQDAKAIVITSPTYYGTCLDIRAISNITKKYNMSLLLDSAHGAHFPFLAQLPLRSIGLEADMHVVSTHKTLPCLTQTAILNVSNSTRVDIDKLKFMLHLYQSTSPSYILMSSIEAGLSIMKTDGEKLLSRVISWISHLRDELPSFYTVLSPDENRACIHCVDPTRLVISCSLQGNQLLDILRQEYNIQVEMADARNIVIIGTAFDKEEDYRSLLSALIDIENKYRDKQIRSNTKQIFDYSSTSSMPMDEAYLKPSVSIDIKESVGRICGEMIAPYPPGIPVLLPGEIITYNKIRCLKEAIDLDIQIDGISDKTLKTIKVINT
ncbi:MAG: aminotransferase class V-fold PLP-dependent enzyme [Clostridium sp.]